MIEEKTEEPKIIREAVKHADGSILGSWDYFCFDPGDNYATLDGHFSAEDLRAIADYMDRHKETKR